MKAFKQGESQFYRVTLTHQEVQQYVDRFPGCDLVAVPASFMFRKDNGDLVESLVFYKQPNAETVENAIMEDAKRYGAVQLGLSPIIRTCGILMRLTNQELATVLAALRNWQEITSSDGGCDAKETSPEHFVNEVPLNTTQIDALCERLNMGG